jgi:hypothetical protein
MLTQLAPMAFYDSGAAQIVPKQQHAAAAATGEYTDTASSKPASEMQALQS